MLNLITFLRRRLRRPRKARISVNHHHSGDESSLKSSSGGSAAAIHPNPEKPIRVATFNAAMFSMAPAVPNKREFTSLPLRSKSTAIDRPKSILKQSPLHPTTTTTTTTSDSSRKQRSFAKSRLRVSINLPDNEISRQLSFREDPQHSPLRMTSFSGEIYPLRSSRTVLEVLRELDADVLALQDVKADEADEMRPLSDLAAALGMNYVFAESWAPEYGNAVLSKWPIKNSNVQKIFDHTDFRNVLKATIDVPGSGEVEFHCTHLDHLDENWRMKQVDAILRSNTNVPHILAGALNSLDESDYSPERWTDIIKYYEEMGKPIPKAEVMRFLKTKEYTDAKDFAGECESVVVVAKGQSVQGTCKYGTRVDYILASSDSPYRFVPGSYSVLSSKGTSDHHIVKVDVVKAKSINVEKEEEHRPIRRQKSKRVTKSTYKASWKTHYYVA